MARTTTVFPYPTTMVLSSDALFRAWGKAISDDLTARGWAKTADSGQIDWASVTKPAGAGSLAGYEIRTSPSEGGLTTLYLRIEYCTGSAATIGHVGFIVGTGSNGSGTVTTALAVQPTGKTNYAGASVLYGNWGVSGDGGKSISVWCEDYTSTAGTANLAFIVSLERTTDDAGEATNDGVAAYAFCYNAASGAQMLKLPSTVASADSAPGLSTFRSNNLPATPSAQFVMPFFAQDGTRYWQLLDVVWCPATRAGAEFVATVKGSPRTYRVICLDYAANYFGLQTRAMMAVAIRVA